MATKKQWTVESTIDQTNIMKKNLSKIIEPKQQKLIVKPTEYNCMSVQKMYTLAEQIQFLHAATFSPTKQTSLKAINQGFF